MREYLNTYYEDVLKNPFSLLPSLGSDTNFTQKLVGAILAGQSPYDPYVNFMIRVALKTEFENTIKYMRYKIPINVRTVVLH